MGARHRRQRDASAPGAGNSTHTDFADVDGDGEPDIVLGNENPFDLSPTGGGHNRLLVNDGTGRFSDQTPATGSPAAPDRYFTNNDRAHFRKRTAATGEGAQLLGVEGEGLGQCLLGLGIARRRRRARQPRPGQRHALRRQGRFDRAHGGESTTAPTTRTTSVTWRGAAADRG